MVFHIIFILSSFTCPAPCNHMMVSNLQKHLCPVWQLARPVATEILSVWQPSWSGSPADYILLHIWFPDSLTVTVTFTFAFTTNDWIHIFVPTGLFDFMNKMVTKSCFV